MLEPPSHQRPTRHEHADSATSFEVVDSPPPYESLSPELQAMLRFAPEYALGAAIAAVFQAHELQRSGLLLPGTYYMVLADLVGSTKYMEEHGNAKGEERIQQFITTCTSALTSAGVKNTALFIKEIGDAVLLAFQHFPDVLTWHQTTDAAFEDRDIEFRTVANLGEISFDGINPVALAVCQLFKLEKYFDSGAVGMAEMTFAIAAPSVEHCHLRSSRLPTPPVEMPGVAGPVQLHLISSTDVPADTLEAWEAANQEKVEEDKDW